MTDRERRIRTGSARGHALPPLLLRYRAIEERAENAVHPVRIARGARWDCMAEGGGDEWQADRRCVGWGTEGNGDGEVGVGSSGCRGRRKG